MPQAKAHRLMERMATAPSLRYWVLLLAWFGWIFDIADTALFNFAKAPMLIHMLGERAYRDHGPQIEAQILSVFLLGWSVGGLAFGILADRWSRSKTLVLTVVLYAGCTGLTALCRTPGEVCVARFVTALGIGGEWAAGATMVAERFSDQERPLAASLLQTAAAFGPMLAALANLLLARQPWQSLFLVGILPAAFCVFLRQAHVAETRKPSSTPASGPNGDLKRIGGRIAAATLVGTAGIAGAGTATFWLPNLVRECSPGLSAVAIANRTGTVALVSHMGTLAGVFVAPWFCKKLGRRPTIAAYFVAAPISVALAVAEGGNYLRLIALMPLVNFFAIGVAAAFALYFPELFPAPFRATGSGMAYSVGRVFSIPVPLFTAWAIHRMGESVAAGVMISGTVYLVGLAALPFLPETRGRPLGADLANL